MENKTKEELETELRLHYALEKEREINDKKFAIKMIERIVFAIIATMALGVLGAILKLVILQ